MTKTVENHSSHRAWWQFGWFVGGLVILLLLVVATLISGIVRYRVPGILWRTIDQQQNPIPEISFDRSYPTRSIDPQLRYLGHNQSLVDTKAWQAAGRAKLRELLRLDDTEKTFSVRLVGAEQLDDVSRETLIFTQRDGQETPAYLLIPNGADSQATVIVIPGHSRGIVATAGIVEDYQHANALAIARAGYVVLTMEVRGFGYLASMDSGKGSADYGAHVAYTIASGHTPLGMTIGDVQAGINYLQSRKEVDSDRLAVVGFSSGGKAAIYLAAIDERIKAVVASGCVSSHASNFLFSRHDSYEAVPGIAAWLEMSDCLGLIAPRPMLVHWGALDNDHVKRCAAFNETSLDMFEGAMSIYQSLGKEDALSKAITPGMGHEFDNGPAIEFLTKKLPPTLPARSSS